MKELTNEWVYKTDEWSEWTSLLNTVACKYKARTSTRARELDGKANKTQTQANLQPKLQAPGFKS